MNQSRILVFALGALVALAATVGIVAAASDDGERAARAGGGGGFDPRDLKGKWTGTWENTTFDTTGSIRANVKFRDGKFIPLVDFGGAVFGCSNPAAESVTLKDGKGEDRWNGKGFRLSQEFDAFGQLDLSYKDSTGVITAEGSAPPCNAAITYTIDGDLTSNKFTAVVTIDLGNGQTAVAELSAKEQ